MTAVVASSDACTSRSTGHTFPSRSQYTRALLKAGSVTVLVSSAELSSPAQPTRSSAARTRSSARFTVRA